ncbi:MAG: type II secretion system protein [Chloroflexi bacterium]|nr:MAG: type II secretion system protein [Chloroflexota bacterium]
MNNPKKNTGFTIVELLIVIVVIGILAAITIVAFNGIQQRARNTQVITGVNAYVKALKQYQAINSEYPPQAGCMGAGYPSNQCWVGSQGNYGVGTDLDTRLATVMSGPKPTLATSLMAIGINDNTRAGALYNVTPVPRVVFYLQGINQPCTVAGANGGNEGGVVTQCVLNL